MSFSKAYKMIQRDIDLKQATSAPKPRTYVGPIVAFTDGSCIGNGRRNAKGGYGVAFPDHPEVDSAWPINDGVTPTNNRAEYYGWLAACGLAEKMDEIPDSDPEAVQKRRSLVIYTDSELLVKTVTTWISTWAKNGYTKRDGSPVANRDLVERISTQLSRRAIKTVYVRAHTDGDDFASIMNDKADQLARRAATEQRAL